MIPPIDHHGGVGNRCGTGNRYDRAIAREGPRGHRRRFLIVSVLLTLFTVVAGCAQSAPRRAETTTSTAAATSTLPSTVPATTTTTGASPSLLPAGHVAPRTTIPWSQIGP